MASWVFLGMAVLFVAAWAGLVLHVVILVCAVAADCRVSRAYAA